MTSKVPSHQPTIGFDLTRSLAATEAAATALTAVGFTQADAVAHLTQELYARSVGRLDKVVPAALSARALAWLNDTLVETESEFSRILHLSASPAHISEFLRALQESGVAISSLRPAVLAQFSHVPAVMLVSRVILLRSLREWIVEGDLELALLNAFEAPTTPQESLSVLVKKSFDPILTDKLTWALINLESHHHVNLIWHQANKLTRTFPDRSPADLFGWGWQGLRMALRNFDPALGFRFSTYACTRIGGTIRDGVRSENPIPKRLTTFVRKVHRAEEDLVQLLGRSPSIDEVALHLDEDPQQLKIMPRLAAAASLEEMNDAAANGQGAPAWLVDGEDPAALAVNAALADAIDSALEKLPEEEALAVRLLVMDALDPKEARMQTGATARQMRVRRDKGLSLLRNLLSEWDSAALI